MGIKTHAHIFTHIHRCRILASGSRGDPWLFFFTENVGLCCLCFGSRSAQPETRGSTLVYRGTQVDMVSASDLAKRALVTLMKRLAALYSVDCKVTRDSAESEMRTGYRKLSVKTHPDRES